jgi:hypothetical protein
MQETLIWTILFLASHLEMKTEGNEVRGEREGRGYERWEGGRVS